MMQQKQIGHGEAPCESRNMSEIFYSSANILYSLMDEKHALWALIYTALTSTPNAFCLETAFQIRAFIEGPFKILDTYIEGIILSYCVYHILQSGTSQHWGPFCWRQITNKFGIDRPPMLSSEIFQSWGCPLLTKFDSGLGRLIKGDREWRWQPADCWRVGWANAAPVDSDEWEANRD